jgi:hypothetical protein
MREKNKVNIHMRIHDGRSKKKNIYINENMVMMILNNYFIKTYTELLHLILHMMEDY